MNFPKMTICRGLPASGKSSWSREQVRGDLGNTVRVNRDLLRLMLNDNLFIKKITEPVTVSARNALIRAYLKQGKHVIIDDTNLDLKSLKSLVKIGEFFGAEVTFQDFDVDVNTCVERDKLRESKGEITVGENVVRQMAKQFFVNGHLPPVPDDFNLQAITFEPFVPDPSKPKAVIFDIDGTVADHTGVRSPYDYTKVALDKPRGEIIDLVNMHYEAGFGILFLSGREDICYIDTVEWLQKHLNNPDIHFGLFMRATGDGRQDRIIKGELFDMHARPYWNVRRVFDDRDAVVSFWRNELKLDCLQVNYGDF